MNEHYRTPLFILTLAFSLCVTQALAWAMGKRPGQGRVAAVSRLTPEQELRAKAEFDSLMAIYDPWEAVKGDRSQLVKLNISDKSKAELFNSLKTLDERYSCSKIGDLILSRLITIHLMLIPNKDTIDGPLPAKPNPRYKDHYNEGMRYSLRLADDYPGSPYADKMLTYIGMTYAGFLDERDGKYIKPYVELVKRYPKSKFIIIALYMISRQAESEAEKYYPDIETRIWAYTLWREKYEEGYIYMNFFEDPEVEEKYNNIQNIQYLKEEATRYKKENGNRILNIIATSIGHSLESYKNINGSFPIYETNSKSALYAFLSPFYWENDVLKKINPFKISKDIKLKYFRSDKNSYKYELQFFDVEQVNERY